MTPTCQACGQPIPRTVVSSSAVWKSRVFCSMACRRKLACKAATVGRVQEVERLLAWGESPYQIATQLGLRPHSLGRWLQRHGRPDLARNFDRADRRAA